MNKRGWTTTKLIAVGSFGVLRVLVWLPFVAINVSTSSPLLTIFSFFFFSFISVFSLLTIRQFGTVTIQTFVEWVLELPLPSMAFMPLLFASAIVRASAVDILFYLFKKKEKVASVVCGGFNSLILSVLTYVIYLIMGVPGTEKIPSIIFTPIGLFLVLTIILGIGSVGGYTGYLTYRKMSSTSVIKRIQGMADV